MSKIPRIAGVAVDGPTTLAVSWKTGGSDRIDLAGWLAKASAVMAPLRDPDVFRRAAVGEYGADVTWDDGEGDLAIDAFHLERLAELQRPFGSDRFKAAQERLGLSNAELARVLGLGLTAIAAYRSGAQAVPVPVAISMRAILADPTILFALHRPSAPGGRPRKTAA